MNTWRYLLTGFTDGATNMAIDEALALGAPEEEAQPVLRFYGWRPYTISIGFHQRAEDINQQKCLEDGIGLVRRPTGGRAVLHAEELTYSVFIPRASPWYGSGSLEIYQLIGRGLVEGVRALGVKAQLERFGWRRGEARERSRTPLCFSSTGRHEVTFQGRKLIGSAQRRYPTGVLQHGSILLGDFHAKIVQYLANGAVMDKNPLAAKTISIGAILQRPVEFAEAAEHFKVGFEKALGLHLEPDQLTLEEQQRAQQLRENYLTWRT